MALRSSIAAAVPELSERAELLRVREERDRDLAVDAARVDVSDAGMRRLRNMQAQDRTFRTNVKELLALWDKLPEPDDAGAGAPDAEPVTPGAAATAESPGASADAAAEAPEPGGDGASMPAWARVDARDIPPDGDDTLSPAIQALLRSRIGLEIHANLSDAGERTAASGDEDEEWDGTEGVGGADSRPASGPTLPEAEESACDATPSRDAGTSPATPPEAGANGASLGEVAAPTEAKPAAPSEASGGDGRPTMTGRNEATGPEQAPVLDAPRHEPSGPPQPAAWAAHPAEPFRRAAGPNPPGWCHGPGGVAARSTPPRDSCAPRPGGSRPPPPWVKPASGNPGAIGPHGPPGGPAPG